MRVLVHPTHPQERALAQAIEVLESGGVIIYPTDTAYAFGCDIENRKAVERICRIKGVELEKAHLSCVCDNVAIIGRYANHVDTTVFKIMRQALPGPYTFILEASKQIPRHFQYKKTVGIRVPDHPVPVRLSALLGRPIASISVPADEQGLGYDSDPARMEERFGKLVELILDAGEGSHQLSTVIDASKGEAAITVIREGAGPLEPLGLILAE
jgi:tRNA threonylcarbamoyl adenosine modification protein (Sua5/YciO/YrdC/YwlC family)